MTVSITIQNDKGESLGSFVAEDTQSISQMAAKNNIEIPVACWMWACYVCACKIKKGSEFVQIDKITTPSTLPQRDELGNFTEVLSCIGGVKSEYIKDKEQHEIILEKMI